MSPLFGFQINMHSVFYIHGGKCGVQFFMEGSSNPSQFWWIVLPPHPHPLAPPPISYEMSFHINSIEIYILFITR